MAVKLLTYAQAETLAGLYAARVVTDEISFDPYQIFPDRNNRDNGRRRCVTTLARKGLLKSESLGHYRPNRVACDAAWNTWRQENPNAQFGETYP